MRYLAKAESKKVRAKEDAVQWKKRPPTTLQIGGLTVTMDTLTTVGGDTEIS